MSSEATDQESPRYEIRVVGHLDPRWSAWFDGLALSLKDDGTTVISGPIVDQAALHGVLRRLRDVGLSLVSITQVETLPPANTPENPHPTQRSTT
jgi:hypothetical protein